MFSRRNASAFAAKAGREQAPVSGGHRVASGRRGSWAPASQVGSLGGLTSAFAANAGLTPRSARVGSRKGAFWLSERGGFRLTENSLRDRRGDACVRDFPLLAGRTAPGNTTGSWATRDARRRGEAAVRGGRGGGDRAQARHGGVAQPLAGVAGLARRGVSRLPAASPRGSRLRTRRRGGTSACGPGAGRQS